MTTIAEHNTAIINLKQNQEEFITVFGHKSNHIEFMLRLAYKNKDLFNACQNKETFNEDSTIGEHAKQNDFLRKKKNLDYIEFRGINEKPTSVVRSKNYLGDTTVLVEDNFNEIEATKRALNEAQCRISRLEVELNTLKMSINK